MVGGGVAGDLLCFVVVDVCVDYQDDDEYYDDDDSFNYYSYVSIDEAHNIFIVSTPPKGQGSET